MSSAVHPVRGGRGLLHLRQMHITRAFAVPGGAMPPTNVQPKQAQGRDRAAQAGIATIARQANIRHRCRDFCPPGVRLTRTRAQASR
jgi:hypothetical protein